MNNYRVIIVDDEPNVRKTLRVLGKWNDYNMEIIAEASDGAEAYQMIAEFSPDIVISDIKMPYFDGLELIDKMRKRKIDSIVLFISGYDKFSYAQEAMRLGACGYLLKPINPNELNFFLANIYDKLKKKNHSLAFTESGLSQEMIFKKGKLDIYLIEAFIKQNFVRNISLEETADLFFISKEYLSKRFKEETGLNFSKYVLKLRMEKAKELLENKYTPSEVSKMLNYVDHVHFHKVFKKYFGVTPGNINLCDQ